MRSSWRSPLSEYGCSVTFACIKGLLAKGSDHEIPLNDRVHDPVPVPSGNALRRPGARAFWQSPSGQTDHDTVSNNSGPLVGRRSSYYRP